MSDHICHHCGNSLDNPNPDCSECQELNSIEQQERELDDKWGIYDPI